MVRDDQDMQQSDERAVGAEYADAQGAINLIFADYDGPVPRAEALDAETLGVLMETVAPDPALSTAFTAVIESILGHPVNVTPPHLPPVQLGDEVMVRVGSDDFAGLVSWIGQIGLRVESKHTNVGAVIIPWGSIIWLCVLGNGYPPSSAAGRQEMEHSRPDAFRVSREQDRLRDRGRAASAPRRAAERAARAQEEDYDPF